MRSRLEALEEFATYTILLWVVLNFVVFRLVFGTDFYVESALALAVAGAAGYIVFEYSTSRLPGREAASKR